MEIHLGTRTLSVFVKEFGPLTGSMNQRDRHFKRGDVWSLLGIALPLCGAYIAEALMPLGNTMIVARLGTEALAGVGLASNLLLFLLVVGIDVVGITSVLMAESRGRGDDLGLSNTIGHGLWLATLLSIPGTILCWILPDILRASGEPSGIVEQTRLYLHPAAWCVLPTFWNTVIRSFATAVARTRPIMFITTASVVVNLLMCYVLVFGGLGVAPSGVSGIGYARSIVGVLTLIAMTTYVARSKELRRFDPFRGVFRMRPQRLWEILRLGLPAAGFTLLENGLFSAVGILVGFVGTAALAASQIGLTVIEFGVVIAFAIGDAAVVRIGLLVGRGDHRGTRRAAHSALLLGAGSMFLVSSLLWLNARKIVALFIDTSAAANSETVRLAIMFLSIAAVFQVFDGLQVIGTRILWGIRDTVTPVWVAILGFWLVGIGGGCCLTFGLKLGGSGLWWGLAIGLAVAALLLVWRFEVEVRRTPPRFLARSIQGAAPYAPPR